VTGAIRNANISAIPAGFYLVVTFVARVVVGWCENTGAASCLNGYGPQTALRPIFFELAPMLAVAWGALLLGFLPFPRLRLTTAAALKCGAVASISAILSLPFLGSIALALLPVVAFAWSYRLAQRPNESLEHTREG
jgi:hypothetical protein